MEVIEDGEEGDLVLDDDEQDLITPRYNSAYGEITNSQTSVHTGPYFALQDDNVTTQIRFQQQNDRVQKEAFQEIPNQVGEIFYDPVTSEEDELQEIARHEGDRDSPFTETPSGTSEDLSLSSDPESEELRGEGRRGPRPRGRNSRSAASRGPRRRGWKWAIKGTEHEQVKTRPPRARVSQRAKTRGRKGPRAVRPNEEFQQTMTRANQAYLDGNFEDALDFAREAVLINPEVYSAHSLLSQVLDEVGRHDDALGALLAGAHASREKQVWYNVVQRTTEHEGMDRDALLNQLLYCYSQILTIDQQDFKARMERAKIYLELGRKARVRTECETMLKYRPHEPEIARMMSELSTTPEENRRLCKLWENIFQLRLEGKARDVGRLEWLDLVLYIDMLRQECEYAKACTKLSQAGRWLLGRGAEDFWDETVNDDREWDLEDAPRRIKTHNFKPDRYPKQTYGAGLPLELRVRLGILRLHMGQQHHEEAIRHFQHLEPDSNSRNAPITAHESLFQDVAMSLKSSSLFQKAIEYFEALLRVRRQFDWELSSALSHCYRQVGLKNKGRERLRAFVEVNEQHIDARVALAKWCEEDGEVEEASDLVTEVIRLGRMDAVRRARLRSLRAARRRHPDIAKTSNNVPLTAAAIKANEQSSMSIAQQLNLVIGADGQTPMPKRSKKRAQSFNDDIQEMHIRMKALEDSGALEEPEALDDWLTIAEVMTEDFRAMRSFYSGHSRFEEDQNLATACAISEMKSLASRISNRSSGKSGHTIDASEVLPPDYCGISWDAWFDMFCQYALQLAKIQEPEACYGALTATVDAIVFQTNENFMKDVHVCWLACGIILEDEQTVCNVARWFVKRYPYTNEGISMFAVANRLLHCEPNWYNSGPSQKFILRQIKGMDYALLDPKARESYNFTENEKRTYGDRATKDNPHHLTELDPILLMVYGHLLAVTGSYANALNYYFRAYTAQPDNPMILLCLALNYVQMSMKRQSENRQFHIQQGLALLSKYYEIQTADNVAIRVQEAEFNAAKVWHLLGLNHLAIPAYKKCLALSKRVQDERGDETNSENFAAEAAFALQHILAISGQQEEARSITEEWLVL